MEPRVASSHESEIPLEQFRMLWHTAQFVQHSHCSVQVILPRLTGAVVTAQEAAHRAGVTVTANIESDALALQFAPSIEVLGPDRLAEEAPPHCTPSEAAYLAGGDFASPARRRQLWLRPEPAVSVPGCEQPLSAAMLGEAIFLTALLANLHAGTLVLDRFGKAIYVRTTGKRACWPESSWEGIIGGSLVRQSGCATLDCFVDHLVPDSGQPWVRVVDQVKAGLQDRGIESSCKTEPPAAWPRYLLSSFRELRPEDWALLRSDLRRAMRHRRPGVAPTDWLFPGSV